MATSTEYARILPGTGYVLAPRVPRGLTAAVEGLAREVLRHRPEDIYVFAARHFEELVKLREEATVTTVTKTENELERCNLVRARRIVESLETTGTKKVKNQVNRSGWSINETARVLRKCKRGFESDIERKKSQITQQSPDSSESTRKNLGRTVSRESLKNAKLELRRNKGSDDKFDSGNDDRDEPLFGRRTRSLEIPVGHQRFERPGKTRSVASAGSAENAIDRERISALSRPTSNDQGERERSKLEEHLENVERFDFDLRRMSESVLPIRRGRSGEEIPVSLPAVRPSSCKYSRNESRVNVNELKNFTLPPISGDAARPKRRDNLTLPALPIAAGNHLGQRAEAKLAVLGTSSSEYQEPTSVEENAGQENNIELASSEWPSRPPGDIQVSEEIQTFPEVDIETNLKAEEVFEDSLNVTPDSADRSQRTDSLEPDVLEVENVCPENPENDREKEEEIELHGTNELKDKLIEIEKVEKSIERALISSQKIADTTEDPNGKEEEFKEIETQEDEPGIGSDPDGVTRESSARRTNSGASIQEEASEKKDELPTETFTSKENNDIISYVLTEGSPLEIPESIVTVTRNEESASLFGEKVQEDALDDASYLRGIKNTFDSKPLARQDLDNIKEEEEEDGVNGDGQSGQDEEETLPLKNVIEEGEKMKESSERDRKIESSTSLEEEKVDVDLANDGQEESPKDKDKSAGESRETGESECWIEPKEATSSGRSNDSLSSDAPPRPYVPELNLDSLRDVTMSSSMKTSYLEEDVDARKNGAFSCQESETTSSFPETLPSEKKTTSEEVESPREEEGNLNPKESEIAQELVGKQEDDSSSVEEEIARELIGNNETNDLSPAESLESNSSAHRQSNEQSALVDDRAAEVNDHIQREQTINPEEREEESAMLDAAVRKIQSRVRGFLRWKRRLRVAASAVNHPSDAADAVATLPSLIEEGASELSSNIPADHHGKNAENITDADEVQEEKRGTKEKEEKVERSENESTICIPSGLQHTGEFHDSLPLALFVPRNGEIHASLSQKQHFNKRDTVLTRPVDCENKEDKESSREDVPTARNIDSPRPNVFYAMELSKALAQSSLDPSISSERYVGILPYIVHIDRASDVEAPFPKLDHEHAVDDLREPLALPETPKPLVIEEISNMDKDEEKSANKEEKEESLSEGEKGEVGEAMEVEDERKER